MAETPEAANTKRCPRCETTKHKSEFTSRGMCRPCSREYGRERYAMKNGAPSVSKAVAVSAVIESGGG